MGSGGGLGYKNNIAVTPLAPYTVVVGSGGAGSNGYRTVGNVNSGGSGGAGALRIVWPGDARSFPSSNVSESYYCVATVY
jgi:hypothetical protein